MPLCIYLVFVFLFFYTTLFVRLVAAADAAASRRAGAERGVDRARRVAQGADRPARRRRRGSRLQRDDAHGVELRLVERHHHVGHRALAREHAGDAPEVVHLPDLARVHVAVHILVLDLAQHVTGEDLHVAVDVDGAALHNLHDLRAVDGVPLVSVLHAVGQVEAEHQVLRDVVVLRGVVARVQLLLLRAQVRVALVERLRALVEVAARLDLLADQVAQLRLELLQPVDLPVERLHAVALHRRRRAVRAPLDLGLDGARAERVADLHHRRPHVARARQLLHLADLAVDVRGHARRAEVRAPAVERRLVVVRADDHRDDLARPHRVGAEADRVLRHGGLRLRLRHHLLRHVEGLRRHTRLLLQRHALELDAHTRHGVLPLDVRAQRGHVRVLAAGLAAEGEQHRVGAERGEAEGGRLRARDGAAGRVARGEGDVQRLAGGHDGGGNVERRLRGVHGLGAAHVHGAVADGAAAHVHGDAAPARLRRRELADEHLAALSLDDRRLLDDGRGAVGSEERGGRGVLGVGRQGHVVAVPRRDDHGHLFAHGRRVRRARDGRRVGVPLVVVAGVGDELGGAAPGVGAALLHHLDADVVARVARRRDALDLDGRLVHGRARDLLDRVDDAEAVRGGVRRDAELLGGQLALAGGQDRARLAHDDGEVEGLADGDGVRQAGDGEAGLALLPLLLVLLQRRGRRHVRRRDERLAAERDLVAAAALLEHGVARGERRRGAVVAEHLLDRHLVADLRAAGDGEVDLLDLELLLRHAAHGLARLAEGRDDQVEVLADGARVGVARHNRLLHAHVAHLVCLRVLAQDRLKRALHLGEGSDTLLHVALEGVDLLLEGGLVVVLARHNLLGTVQHFVLRLQLLDQAVVVGAQLVEVLPPQRALNEHLDLGLQVRDLQAQAGVLRLGLGPLALDGVGEPSAVVLLLGQDTLGLAELNACAVRLRGLLLDDVVAGGDVGLVVLDLRGHVLRRVVEGGVDALVALDVVLQPLDRLLRLVEPLLHLRVGLLRVLLLQRLVVALVRHLARLLLRLEQLRLHVVHRLRVLLDQTLEVALARLERVRLLLLQREELLFDDLRLLRVGLVLEAALRLCEVLDLRTLQLRQVAQLLEGLPQLRLALGAARHATHRLGDLVDLRVDAIDVARRQTLLLVRRPLVDWPVRRDGAPGIGIARGQLPNRRHSSVCTAMKYRYCSFY
eukprot:Rhum_TRINITY_DN15397_c4_g1::Rhum_TRINITY_DN15397_c4_g1_i1::g.154455::m.154455